MNRHIKFLLTLIFCLALLKSFAQTISNSGDLYGGSQIPEKIDVNSIEGIPYLYDDFKIGDVYFGNRFKTPQVLLRLNLYSDEMEFIENDIIKIYAEPNWIDKIVLEDEVFICLSNPRFKTRKRGFVKMWNSSYPSVLTKMRVIFYKDAVKAFSETKPIRFERDKDLHYLMKSEDDIVLISTVQKLIDLLEDHSEALSKYAEEENISVSNGADLSRLLDYYHQLSAQDL